MAGEMLRLQGLPTEVQLWEPMPCIFSMGIPPQGTLVNGCSIYSDSGELYTMDAAGNATLQTPHNDQGEWIFYSKNTVTGKVLRIDAERMFRYLNDLMGGDFIQEFKEAL